ncbi:MAG: DUF488 family protein [Terrimicrobiaceae bacterium]
MIAPRKETQSTPTLLTIGYEGLDVDRFFKFLVSNSVKALVDVRELPFSRKKGFSKNALSASVEKAGIRYAHIKALGSPSEIRHALKADDDYPAFFQAFDKHLDAQGDALESVSEMLDTHERVCLMCFEADQALCHRSIVAKRLAELFQGQITVEPLTLKAS